MGFMWDMYASQRIAEGQVKAEQGLAAADEAVRRVADLEWKVNRLTLVNMALVELLTMREELTEAQIMDKMHEIDLRDGAEDGRVNEVTLGVCESCGRPYSKRHKGCMYCGHVNATHSVF